VIAASLGLPFAYTAAIVLYLRSTGANRTAADRLATHGADAARRAYRVSSSFGEVLRAARERRERSQEHLAEAAGLDRAAVALFERGEMTPGLDVLGCSGAGRLAPRDDRIALCLRARGATDGSGRR
jgi:hypothetical protein